MRAARQRYWPSGLSLASSVALQAEGLRQKHYDRMFFDHEEEQGRTDGP
jgi:hypothetical protein